MSFSFPDADKIILDILPQLLDDALNKDKTNRKVTIYRYNTPVEDVWQRDEGEGHYDPRTLKVDIKTGKYYYNRKYAYIIKGGDLYNALIQGRPKTFMRFFMTLENDDHMNGPVKVTYDGDMKSSYVNIHSKEDAEKFARGDAFTNSMRVINKRLGTTQKSEAHWAALDKLVDIVDRLH